MNPTLPTILAIAGLIFILLAVVGTLRVHNSHARAKTRSSRIILFVVGALLLIAAYFVYQSDKPAITNGGENKNTNSNSTPPPTPISTPQPTELSIVSPASNSSVDAELDDGAGRIASSGILKGTADLSNMKIFVFSNTNGSSEWWYDEPATIEPDGAWTGSALFGSREEPVKLGQAVVLRAVAATAVEMEKATSQSGDSKMLKGFGAFKKEALSKPVTVTIKPIRKR